jgi:hypothetical protein
VASYKNRRKSPCEALGSDFGFASMFFVSVAIGSVGAAVRRSACQVDFAGSERFQH